MNQSIDKMGRIHNSRQKLSVFWLLCLVGSLNASIIFGKMEGGEAGGENENVAMCITTVRVWHGHIITVTLILCVGAPGRNKNLTTPSFAYQFLGVPILKKNIVQSLHHNRKNHSTPAA